MKPNKITERKHSKFEKCNNSKGKKETSNISCSMEGSQGIKQDYLNQKLQGWKIAKN